MTNGIVSALDAQGKQEECATARPTWRQQTVCQLKFLVLPIVAPHQAGVADDVTSKDCR
jgi:hypothetical protein